MTTDSSSAMLESATVADPVYAASKGRQWGLVVCLTVMSMLAMIDKFILSLLIDPIRNHFHFTDTQISLVVGVAFAAANLAISVPAGYLADRFSRRGLVAIGVVVWSTMAAACGLAGNYLQFLLARAAVGLGEGLIPPPSFSMIRDAVSPERRGVTLSVYAMANMVGTALAFIAGGILIGVITHSGLKGLPLLGPLEVWQLTLIAVGVGGLPLVLLLLLVKEPQRNEANRAKSGMAGVSEAWTHVVANRAVYAPLFVFATSNMLVAQAFAAWLPTMLKRDWALPAQVIGVGFGLMMLVLAPPGMWLAGLFLDRLRRMGRRGPALVGLVSTIGVWICATATPLAPSLAFLWPMIGLLMFTSATFVPVTPFMVSLTAPPALTGRVMGLQLLIQGLFAVAMAPTITAVVSDRLYGGGPHALAHALATVALVCGAISTTAILMVLRETRRDPAPAA